MTLRVSLSLTQLITLHVAARARGMVGATSAAKAVASLGLSFRMPRL
ncbi:MAG: hypothetical protein LAT68_11600 [Cyclobacteriaceae bacterium]|nr:hypothetical protein [Cyclobacteriaceae bacterium]